MNAFAGSARRARGFEASSKRFWIAAGLALAMLLCFGPVAAVCQTPTSPSSGDGGAGTAYEPGFADTGKSVEPPRECPPAEGLTAYFEVYEVLSVNAGGAPDELRFLGAADEDEEGPDEEPIRIPLGVRVLFNASCSNEAAYFCYYYGDGTYNLDVMNPQERHAYSTAQEYTVRLTVYDAQGWESQQILQPVTVAATLEYVDRGPILADEASHTAVYGDYAWVTHLGELLTCYEIIPDPVNPEDPPNVVPVSTVVAHHANRLAVGNGHLYLCARSAGMHVYTATPSAPQYRSTWLGASAPAYDAVADGDLVYVAAYGAGLCVVDVSNPYSPVEIARQPLPSGVKAMRICVADGVAVVADHASKVHVIDVANPAAPVIKSSVTMGYVGCMSLTADRMFAADAYGSTRLYDLSVLQYPEPLGVFDTASALGRTPKDMVLSGRSLLVGFGTSFPYSFEVARIDIADPQAPYLTESLPLTGTVSGGVGGMYPVGGGVLVGSSVCEYAFVDVIEP